MTADGQWIVYASGNTDKLGIWKIRPDGSGRGHAAGGRRTCCRKSRRTAGTCWSVSTPDLDYVVNVMDIGDGRTCSRSRSRSTPRERQQDLVLGRGRWTPDGRGIVFIGQDDDGRSGVYAAGLQPREATDTTRRALGGFTREYTSESLGVSPDGRSLTISTTFEQRTVKMVEDLDLKHWR